MLKKKTIIISSLLVVIALIFIGISYHQSTHFNTHITINNIKVGGLTADQAISQLKSTVSKNVVYVGQQQIYDGKDAKMRFTKQDLPGVKKILKQQRTLFPSTHQKDYMLAPKSVDHQQRQRMKKAVEKELLAINKGLKAAKDAEAQLEQGKIVISKSVNGKQYDVTRLINDYQKQAYKSEIHLNPVYLKPIKENDPIIKQEENMLKELAGRTVDYKVQDKVYSFQASEVIKHASVSKEMKYAIDMTDIKKKLDEINKSQSTLNKNYTFKTHLGSVISVKGKSYGWALDVDAEAKRIHKAFEKGKETLLAYNVYGIGWNTYGVGYHTTTNHGIGDTYAEVSIKEQRIWIYKDGKLKATTPVVTGRHDTNEDTPKGVWYIEYKETPSILSGSEVGNPNYSVKVNYWAAFTLNGEGFHDAGWRSNWSNQAYLTQGSGGCVNTPPSIMKTVYDNLVQNEPVVIY